EHAEEDLVCHRLGVDHRKDASCCLGDTSERVAIALRQCVAFARVEAPEPLLVLIGSSAHENEPNLHLERTNGATRMDEDLSDISIPSFRTMAIDGRPLLVNTRPDWHSSRSRSVEASSGIDPPGDCLL